MKVATAQFAVSADISANLAGELGLWTVVGSTHRLSAPHKPHNSVYVIDASGGVLEAETEGLMVSEVDLAAENRVTPAAAKRRAGTQGNRTTPPPGSRIASKRLPG
uniref:hypothetical protein n=1 Tax=uncultured Caulobacter sp. TaxID=158749 RepID=UPI0025E1944F|nr:hypothetical protein [uncultured Caulobacter sp.]